MRLRFRGNEKIIYWGRAKTSFRFSPDGDCPDELGEILLNDPKWMTKFKKVDTDLICPICGKEFDKLRAVRMHKNIKHKEKHNEANSSVDAGSFGTLDHSGSASDSGAEGVGVQPSNSVLL